MTGPPFPPISVLNTANTPALRAPETAEEVARVITENPLADGFDAEAVFASGARRVIVRSGWIGEEAEGDIFPASFRTWTVEGWRRFEEACRALANAARAAGAELILWPHHRHVLSDPQACMTLLKRWGDQGEAPPFRLLIEPAAFLTHGMLAAAEDHLRRAFESLTHPESVARRHVAAVVLSGIEPAASIHADAADPELVPAPLGTGVLDPRLLLTPFARLTDPALPVVLRDPGAADQARTLPERRPEPRGRGADGDGGGAGAPAGLGS